MRGYLGLTKMVVQERLAYRLDFFSNVVGILLSMFVFYFLWRAIFSYNNITQLGGLTLEQMMAYSFTAILVNRAISMHLDSDIEEDVRTGFLTSLLTRPLDYQLWLFFSALGSFLGSFLLGGLPAFLIAVFVFGMQIPAWSTIGFFLISLILAFGVQYALLFIVGMYAFYTSGSIWGLRRAHDNISRFFSGQLVPLYFFPVWLAGVAYVLPFQAIYNIPVSIFIGKIATESVVGAYATQLLWIGIMVLLGRLIWNRTHSLFTSQGG